LIADNKTSSEKFQTTFFIWVIKVVWKRRLLWWNTEHRRKPRFVITRAKSNDAPSTS